MCSMFSPTNTVVERKLRYRDYNIFSKTHFITCLTNPPHRLVEHLPVKPKRVVVS